MEEHYDVVIIGSGLGGLVSAIILAKEGRKVCVLEKNQQYGGNLQTFVRDRSIFDTGIHYIGGLDKGQNLYRYFKYLGIMDDLKLKKLDEDRYDVVTFDDEDIEYPHAQGYENFVKQLLIHFPEEEKVLRIYCDKMKEMCNFFPLYNLKKGGFYDEKVLSLNASDYIDSITDNKKLKSVLLGSNFLYAGIANRTPLYVHALSVNSYIESAWRCVNGGSQISKLLIKQLRKYGGAAFKRQEVVGFESEGKTLTTAISKTGRKFKGDLFVSNIDPKRTLDILGDVPLRKVYKKRIQNFESIISGFSLYIVLKPKSFKYKNFNYYHFKDSERVLTNQDYTEATWPEGYMISMSVKKDMDEWAENLIAMTYMEYKDVKKWEDTFNTAAEKGDRGESYEDFKKRKTEVFLNEIEKKFPNIRDCILSIHTSTPLSYRDYIACNEGSMYGYIKDSENPIKSFLSPKTKLTNLYFTGQCINMHGVLGVTISGVLTCSYILGRDYLLDKIHAELGEEEE